MDNFYHDHQFPRLPPQEQYNFRRNDGVDFYNLHVIPTNIPPPMHLPYYPPSMQPDLSFPPPQASPQNSRIVKFTSNRNKYKNSQRGRPNLIEVRSTVQPPIKVRSVEPVVPIIDSSFSQNITENKTLETDSISPFKSHSYESERYIRAVAQPVSTTSYPDSKYSRNVSKVKSFRDSDIRDHGRNYYDKYYYYSDRARKKGDKWKKKNVEPEKDKQSKDKKVTKKLPETETLEDISDTALEDDFEEVEVVSGGDLKDKEPPIGFHKCTVRYLNTKRNKFYRPKIYCISAERTLINYWDYDEDEWYGKEDVEMVSEEVVYEMEAEEHLNGEKSTKKNMKSVKKLPEKVDEKQKEILSQTELKETTSKADLNKEDVVDELVTSTRSYRICMPDLPEFFQGEAIIQPDIDAWKSHLIGLSYIIEIRDKTDDTNILQHHCVLCSEDIHAENDSGEMVIDHISSYKHMFKYLEKHFQSCGFKFSERIEDNFNNRKILQKSCEEICNKLGYDCMCITDDDYYAKNTKAVLKMINDMPHWCEKDIKINLLNYIKEVECNVSKTVNSDTLKNTQQTDIKSISEQKANDKAGNIKANSTPSKEVATSKEKINKSQDNHKLKNVHEEIESSKLKTDDKSNSDSNKKQKTENKINIPKNEFEPSQKITNNKSSDSLKMEVVLEKRDKSYNNEIKKKNANSEAKKESNENNKASNKSKKKGDTAFSASKIAPFSLFSFGIGKKGTNTSHNKKKSKPNKKVPKPQATVDDEDDGIEIIYESNPKSLNIQDDATEKDTSELDKIPERSVNEKKEEASSVIEPQKAECKTPVKEEKIESMLASKELIAAQDQDLIQSNDSEKQKKELALKEPETSIASNKDTVHSPKKQTLSPPIKETVPITEGQKIPVLKEPVLTTFKRKMQLKTVQNKAVRSQTNMSNLKVLKDVETFDAIQPTSNISVEIISDKTESVSNFETDNFKSTGVHDTNRMLESAQIDDIENSGTSFSANDERTNVTPTIETANSDTNANELAYDDLTEEDVSQHSDYQSAPDDSQALKSESDKPAAQHKSPSKKKCCQHKHHHKTTVHSKYCIKRIINRSKISKEAAESIKEGEHISSKDVAVEIKVSSKDDTLKRKTSQKFVDTATSKSRIHRSKSPEKKLARVSPLRRSRSPVKRFKSPIRRYSPISVSRYGKSHSRSPIRRRLSPLRRVSRSPRRRLSRSPVRRQNRSPIKRRSRSPFRRQSRSPFRRQSRSPFRRQSRSPIRRHSRSPVRRQSRSPIRRLSRSPFRKLSRSPIRRRSRSPFSRQGRSPIRKRSISPFRKHSRSPLSKFSKISSRKRSRSPLRLSSRKHSKSPIRRFSPIKGPISRNSPLRDPSRSIERRLHDSQRNRSESLSPLRKLPRSYDITKMNDPERYLRSSSKHVGHKISDAGRAADLDPVSDEDESVYFNTSEKPQHIEEIMKLPEPTRTVISEMFKKFLSASNVNPNDSSILKFMQFMNAHSGEVQEVMSSPVPSSFNTNPLSSQKRSTIPHLGSGLRSQLPPNLGNQQFHSTMAPNQQNTLLAQNFLTQSVPSFVQSQVFPGAVPNVLPMQFQQSVFPSTSNPIQNLHPFQQQNPPLSSQYVAPGVMIQNLKNTVHKLFGSNEQNILPRNNPPINSKPQPAGGNCNLFHNNSKPNIISQANANVPFQDNNPAIMRDRVFQRNEQIVNKDNVMNLPPSISVPPPDARVSFCNVSSSSSKKNLFPVVSSASSTPNFNPKNTQANVSDVKKSLAQRLAAVLVKVGMIDVPAPLLQEMLMKIGAFSSCPPQDITEDEILNILRRLGYV